MLKAKNKLKFANKKKKTKEIKNIYFKMKFKYII